MPVLMILQQMHNLTDANASLPALGEIPDDSLYGCDENCQKAKESYGVDLIAPVMGVANRKRLSLDDCTLNKQGNSSHVPNPNHR